MTDLSDLSWPDFLARLRPRIESARGHNLTVGLTHEEWIELARRCMWPADDPEPMIFGLPIQIMPTPKFNAP